MATVIINGIEQPTHDGPFPPCTGMAGIDPHWLPMVKMNMLMTDWRYSRECVIKCRPWYAPVHYVAQLDTHTDIWHATTGQYIPLADVLEFMYIPASKIHDLC